MSLQPEVVGVPMTQRGLNKDQVIQWVVTTLNRGQGLSLAKPTERLGAWYQGSCRMETEL